MLNLFLTTVWGDIVIVDSEDIADLAYVVCKEPDKCTKKYHYMVGMKHEKAFEVTYQSFVEICTVKGISANGFPTPSSSDARLEQMQRKH